jgi:hypothetical protein
MFRITKPRRDIFLGIFACIFMQFAVFAPYGQRVVAQPPATPTAQDATDSIAVLQSGKSLHFINPLTQQAAEVAQLESKTSGEFLADILLDSTYENLYVTAVVGRSDKPLNAGFEDRCETN